MSIGPDITDLPPAPEQNKTKEALTQTAIYGSAGAVGIAAAVNKISHNFYREAKNWPGLTELRQTRIDAWAEVATKKGQSFADYITQHKKIEGDYTRDFSKMLEETRGFSKNPIQRVYQEWRASGPHTRREALLSMASTTIITLGGLMALNHSKKLSDAVEKHEEQRSGIGR